MISTDVVIVGGGPAGCAAAWKLKQAGIDSIILDKANFPRLKLCAGWITPRVLKKLEIMPADYPGNINTFNFLHFHIYGIPFPILTRQFSIRRIEFDHWLLKRASVPIHRHPVHHIEQENNTFIIDGAFRCKWLIGAGGTNCPVYRKFFRESRPRERKKQIVSMELEFQTEYRTKKCHLWFFQKGLPGYAWFVPKTKGWLNIGIGGKQAVMAEKSLNIRNLWEQFTDFLVKKKLLKIPPPEPGAYSYYLWQNGPVQRGQVLIVGDAAGLATLDMGEGIGPAIESGILAADTILTGHSFSLNSIPRYSLPGIILFPWKYR